MKPSVKSAIESAALALLVAGICLWFLIAGSRNDEYEQQAATMTLLAIGLAVSIILHLIFVGFAVQRDGRPVGGWMALSILLFPVGSIITLVLIGWLSTESERERRTQAQA